MSYCLHITREDDWMEDEHPVTLEEVEEVLPLLPKGFDIDRSGVVQAELPDGRVLVAEVGPYVTYRNEEGIIKACIYFDSGAPEFKAVMDQDMLPMIELAAALNARVQGDDMEFYTKDSFAEGREDKNSF